MKVLLTGGSGQVGSALRTALAAPDEVLVGSFDRCRFRHSGSAAL